MKTQPSSRVDYTDNNYAAVPPMSILWRFYIFGDFMLSTETENRFFHVRPPYPNLVLSVRGCIRENPSRSSSDRSFRRKTIAGQPTPSPRSRLCRDEGAESRRTCVLSEGYVRLSSGEPCRSTECPLRLIEARRSPAPIRGG